ncbi:hypothetical protein SOASR032_08650 [Pragia fontium]|uniref:Caudovirales tail fibre assembly protein n=1 Tax=Pragia fontium TaxID=82985 RepID=A0ABQ5LFC1_9GAMM|nr:hypothetical protein [Pragia fontium]GKX62296.1 hypothetical protein SOASR032_08650 [Pragia fontium]
MKVYAKLNTSEQLIDSSTSDSLTFDGYIKMLSQRPADGDWHAKLDGLWHKGDPAIEDAFISEQMRVIADELLKHDDDDDSVIATRPAWVEYRKALRKWSFEQNINYPDPSFRPIQPQ